MTMQIGETFRLPVAEGTVYTVSDPYIAYVDENVRLHAVNPGKTEVMVTLPDGETTLYQITIEGVLLCGDANLDGKVTAEDAAQILIFAAARGAGENPVLRSEKPALELRAMHQADTNDNERVNAEDAANILLYAAAAGADGKAEWSAILT